jgi:hypothetical protein
MIKKFLDDSLDKRMFTYLKTFCDWITGFFPQTSYIDDNGDQWEQKSYYTFDNVYYPNGSCWRENVKKVTYYQNASALQRSLHEKE